MSLPGNDLLLEIQNAQDIQTLGTKLGVYMRSYVAPSIQNRGLPGQVLATPSDKVGNVSLQSISSLVGTVNPKNASYVGTNAKGVIVAASTPDAGITELTGDVLAGPGNGAQPSQVVGINSGLVPLSETYVGTNASGQIVSAPTPPVLGTSVYQEQVSGSAFSWTLAHTPLYPAAVQIFVRIVGFGGVLLFQGVSLDYTLSGTAITTAVSYTAGAVFARYAY